MPAPAPAPGGRRLVRPSGRHASAGRILGVGLLCFALWLLLDANQLYNEAKNGDSDGARRNAALDVLRPIAAVANSLHLSGLVNWGASALDRNGSPGGSQHLPAPIIALPSGPPVETRLANGEAYLPHAQHGHFDPLRVSPFVLPPVPQPTASRPLTILDIGDSIGEDLGFGIGDLFSGDRYVHVLQLAQVDTGLVQEGYYDWPGHLELDLERYHPGVVVVMLGGNDDQALNANGWVYEPLTAGWIKAYAQRVRIIMEESITMGAHVMWVGLPPMNGGNITNAFVRGANTIYATEARKLPGVTFFASWPVLAGAKGQFETYLDIGGSEVQVRAPDGVHLDPAGWDYLAQALLKPMERAWHVELHVSS